MAIPADWSDISYLARGTESQRLAYTVLTGLGLPDRLAPYDPVLTGTFPLALDVVGSDLDLICAATDLERFAAELKERFGAQPGFELHGSRHQGLPCSVCNFRTAGPPVQIFAQPRPTREQHAFRHMVVEARLLVVGGPGARSAIRAMKEAGVKTEPAFAAYFGLAGDPYAAVLALESLSAVELERRCGRPR